MQVMCGVMLCQLKHCQLQVTAQFLQHALLPMRHLWIPQLHVFLNVLLCWDTIACAPECATLLGTIRDDYGCCINNVINNTYARLADSLNPRSQNITSLVNYELWSRCNVITPRFCHPESGATVLLNNNILYAVLISVALLLMAWLCTCSSWPFNQMLASE